VLTSDEVLYTDNSTHDTTVDFARHDSDWKAAFVAAVIKMSKLANVTVGEIRVDPLCQVVNA
jgi:hypothetical protein